MRYTMVLLLALGMSFSSTAYASVAEAKVFYKQANSEFKAKNYANAIELYKKVEKEEANYSKYVQGQIGYSYYLMGDKGKALFYLEEHLKNKPNDERALKYIDKLKAEGELPDSVGSGKNLSGEKILNNIVFTNPGAIAEGFLNLGYQRMISEKTSLVVSGSTISLGYSGGNISVLGGSLGVRFSTGGVRGWFAAPKIGYWTGNFDESVLDVTTGTSTTVEFSGSSLGFGGEAGYQWVWGNGIMLALGVGASYINLNMEATATNGTVTESVNGSISGAVPNGFLNVGYAF